MENNGDEIKSLTIIPSHFNSIIFSEGLVETPNQMVFRSMEKLNFRLGKFRTGTAGYGFVSCDLMTEFFGRAWAEISCHDG